MNRHAAPGALIKPYVSPWIHLRDLSACIKAEEIVSAGADGAFTARARFRRGFGDPRWWSNFSREDPGVTPLDRDWWQDVGHGVEFHAPNRTLIRVSGPFQILASEIELRTADAVRLWGPDAVPADAAPAPDIAESTAPGKHQQCSSAQVVALLRQLDEPRAVGSRRPSYAADKAACKEKFGKTPPRAVLRDARKSVYGDNYPAPGRPKKTDNAPPKFAEINLPRICK